MDDSLPLLILSVGIKGGFLDGWCHLPSHASDYGYCSFDE